MPLYISQALARLIKQRSYTSGEIRPLKRRIKDICALLASAEAELAGVKSALAEIDKAIAKEEAELDPEAILVRRRTARRVQCRHGTFVNEIVLCLQASPDKPIPIGAIMNQVAPKVGLPLGNWKEVRYARERIRRVLNILKDKGAVMRLPASEGSSQSMWLWIGL